MNIGLDRNNDPQGVKWFNTQGQWNPSLINGSWMIRPVLGDPLTFPTAIQTVPQIKAVWYPNPATDQLNLRCDCEVSRWLIKDMAGRLALEGKYIEGPISVTHLPNGLYLVELEDSAGRLNRQKLIISR